MLQETKTQVQADGAGDARIAFVRLGGSGPSAVMVHGFGSDRMSWLANQPAIAAVASLSVLDLPGHGASGMDVGDGDVTTMAERVAAVLDRDGLTNVDLIGHSLGGGIAILLADRRPDLVCSLVLIAPAGLGEGVDPSFLSAYPELDEPDAVEALLQRLVARPRLIGKPLVNRVLQQLRRPGARQALRLVARGIADSGAVLEKSARAISRGNLPRMTIWGENDAINPVSHARLKAFGGAVHVVPEAGHLPHIENPRYANESIAAFLTDLRRA
jgi:pimeloyl-ACP methyl ester carboxylesterase